MLKTILAALAAIALLAPVASHAQSATAIGIGTARSTSQSNAVAVSGQGGAGGQSQATVNIAGQPSTTRQEVSGTQTLKNVPTAFAPGLAAAGLETCLGSVSGGGAFVGTGFSFGTTIPDPGCAARLDARTLWSMGLKKAAV